MSNNRNKSSKRSSFRMNSKLESLLSECADQFGSTSRAITFITDRYIALMDAEKADLEKIFSKTELDFLFSVFENIEFEDAGELFVKARISVFEAAAKSTMLSPELKDSIVQKVDALRPGQIFAIVDMSERLRKPATQSQME